MKETLVTLGEQVASGNSQEVKLLVQQLVAKGVDPGEILDGLIKGIDIVGEKWSRFEVFIPDVMLASMAMNVGQAIIADLLKEKGINKSLGVVVVGTVKGDVHDIGKNIVSAMLSSAGFEVIDLGVNVSPMSFIEKARENKAHIIALSSLLTTTMQGQKDVIDLLENTGERYKYKVIVGGGPVTQEWANDIGADGYGETAADAVRICKQLIGSTK